MELDGAEEVLERVMNAEDDLGILGISSVDKAEIERAVKHTLQRIHPDKLPGDKRAQVATERVQRASERLLAGSTMAPAMTSRLKRKHEEAIEAPNGKQGSCKCFARAS